MSPRRENSDATPLCSSQLSHKWQTTVQVNTHKKQVYNPHKAPLTCKHPASMLANTLEGVEA